MQQNSEAAGFASAMREECLGVRIGRLHRQVNRAFENALRPTGISLPQLEVLSTLTLVARPIRPTQLADLLSIDRSTMSRNLTLMQSKGWVGTTETSPTGRSLTVQISEAGMTQLATAQHAWRAAQKQIASSLGEDAVPTLDSWLTALGHD
jgi:DNA-binding MarR family transcriptional regulator